MVVPEWYLNTSETPNARPDPAGTQARGILQATQLRSRGFRSWDFPTPRPQRTVRDRAASVQSHSMSAPYIADTAPEVGPTETRIRTARTAKLLLAPCSWHDLYHSTGSRKAPLRFPFRPRDSARKNLNEKDGLALCLLTAMSLWNQN